MILPGLLGRTKRSKLGQRFYEAPEYALPCSLVPYREMEASDYPFCPKAPFYAKYGGRYGCGCGGPFCTEEEAWIYALEMTPPDGWVQVVDCIGRVLFLP